MRNILSPEGRRALEGFASANVLLGFDYDGTLAPIVADPSRATLPVATRALLAEVAARYPCAIVSGRARADVLRFVENLPLLRIVGNHGLENEARGKAEARAAIVEAACALAGARLVHGKQVVSLVPANAAHKGIAVDEICAQLCCDSAIYVGDDVTDEDVFALPRHGSLLSVRVGRSRTSRAGWYLRRKKDIDELLATLLSMRPPQRRSSAL